jgi:hypothetical protein
MAPLAIAITASRLFQPMVSAVSAHARRRRFRSLVGVSNKRFCGAVQHAHPSEQDLKVISAVAVFGLPHQASASRAAHTRPSPRRHRRALGRPKHSWPWRDVTTTALVLCSRVATRLRRARGRTDSHADGSQNRGADRDPRPQQHARSWRGAQPCDPEGSIRAAGSAPRTRSHRRRWRRLSHACCSRNSPVRGAIALDTPRSTLSAERGGGRVPAVAGRCTAAAGLPEGELLEPAL